MTSTPLRILAVCAALSAPALASAPVHAQPADPAALLAQQRQWFDQGNKLYDQTKLPEAEHAYLQAWKLKKSFDVAGNLGNVEADMKKWRAAGEYLAFAIREFPAGGKPAQRDGLIQRLAEAQKQVGRLRLHVAKPGAEVFVDGASVGLAPLPDDVYVDPGSHLVEVRLDGYPPTQVTLTAARAQVSETDIALKSGGANKKVIIAGAAVAGVAAITGAVLLGVSASKGSSASSLYTTLKASGGCPPASSSPTGQCGQLKSDLDAKSTLGSAGVWMLVGAGVVGLGTLVYGLAGGPRAARTGLVIAPVVTAQGGGFFAQGSF